MVFYPDSIPAGSILPDSPGEFFFAGVGPAPAKLVGFSAIFFASLQAFKAETRIFRASRKDRHKLTIFCPANFFAGVGLAPAK